MKVNKTIAVTMLLCGLLASGLVAGVFLSQRPTSVEAAPAVQQATSFPDDDDVQGEAENEADDASEDTACDQNEADEANEADKANETDTLPGQTSITADQAKKIAEDANPGAKTLAVELDQVNENSGAAIYEVELDNGLDVRVDANNGAILGAEQRDAN